MSSAPPNDLLIRRACVDDAPGFAALFAEPAVYANTLQMPYPSEAHWKARLAANDQPGSRHLVLVAERAGQMVGNAGLHPAGDSARRQHAMSLGICVAGAAQGQGIGRALMDALLHAADHWANVQRIELTVFVDNAAAIALYRSLGFEEEGRLRGYAFRDGAYVDVLSMARWRPALASPCLASGSALAELLCQAFRHCADTQAQAPHALGALTSGKKHADDDASEKVHRWFRYRQRGHRVRGPEHSAAGQGGTVPSS